MLKNILIKSLLSFLVLPCIASAMNNEKIVNSWAAAVQGRNGKEQYKLLCPDQQKKIRNDLESTHWATGVSSPSIGKYKVTKSNETKDSATFLVKYLIVLTGKPIGTVTDTIEIQNGCITKYNYLSPTAVEPTKEPF